MKNRIRKIFVITSIIGILLSLVGCDSTEYKRAEEYFNTGDYSAALEIYSALGEYENAQEKVRVCQYAIATSFFEKQQYEDALQIFTEICEYKDAADLAKFCEKEIGMTTNADYDFLSALETSVLDRMVTTETDFSKLVRTELAYLERFSNMTFYDARLKELADLYLKGLHAQKDALEEEYEADYQIGWQAGLVYRYESLKLLYEEYEFLADNKDFIATYVMNYEPQKDLLDAYRAIEDDIHAQTSSADFDFGCDFSYTGDSGTVYCTLKNNTPHTYSTVFEFSFLSGDNTLFYSNTAYIENIKPGSSYVVEVYVDFTHCATEDFIWNWNNYYYDVQCG